MRSLLTFLVLGGLFPSPATAAEEPLSRIAFEILPFQRDLAPAAISEIRAMADHNIAAPKFFRLPADLARLAESCAEFKDGIARAARTAMMAITTRTSTSVNALWREWGKKNLMLPSPYHRSSQSPKGPHAHVCLLSARASQPQRCS
jgi:hypothetical protein